MIIPGDWWLAMGFTVLVPMQYHCLMSTPLMITVWLADYQGHDLGRYGALFQSRVPTPVGFVVTHRALQEVFFTPTTKMKIESVRDAYVADGTYEIESGRAQIAELIKNIRIPRVFSHSITHKYEQMLEKEHLTQGREVSHLDRAKHVLAYVYRPPTVSISTMPVPNITTIASGSTSILESLKQVVIDHLCLHLHAKNELTLPSILIRRVPQAEFVGTCEQRERDMSPELIISAFHGAVALDIAPDVFVVDPSTLELTARHTMTQPYKMVLHGNHYKQAPLPESLGSLPNISDEIVQRVAKITLDIKRKLYFPHKIYWAIEAGRLIITDIKKS